MSRGVALGNLYGVTEGPIEALGMRTFAPLEPLVDRDAVDAGEAGGVLARGLGSEQLKDNVARGLGEFTWSWLIRIGQRCLAFSLCDCACQY
jgi:hypothetical protein